MNKNMIVLFFLALAAAAGYYCYQQGYFEAHLAHVEKVLEEVCDPEKEDCSTFEEEVVEVEA